MIGTTSPPSVTRHSSGGRLADGRGDRDPSSSDAHGVGHDVAPGQPDGIAGRHSGRGVEREAPRVGAAAVRDQRDHRARPVPRGSRPAVHHPAGQVRVRPVAHRPVQVRGQGDRPGGPVGRARVQGGGEVIEEVRVVHADPRDPAAVRRVCRRANRAGQRQDLARLAPGERNLPDRGTWPAVRVLPRVRGEGDGRAVRAPRDVGGAPGDAGQAPHAPGLRRRDHVHLPHAVDVAGLVPAVVERGHRGARVARPPSARVPR